MRITIDLSEDQTRSLEATAERLGVPAERLAQAAVGDLLTRPQEDFQRAVEYVLDKNRGLYKRLA
jgi:hypothetical protein